MISIGRYSPLLALTKNSGCDACPPGRHGLGEGMTTLDSACGKCTPGLNYQEQSGQASCKPFSCNGEWKTETETENEATRKACVCYCICDSVFVTISTSII